MNAMRLLRGLGPLDARTVGRDSMLRWMLVLPLGTALAARVALPVVAERLGASLGRDLSGIVPVVLVGVILLLTPTLFGMVVGFSLLDQRDEQTLTALQVTPLPLRHYLAYRLAAPLLVGLLMTLAAFPVAGLALGGPALLAAILAAPLSPLVALALVVFAENKVQGLALLKGLSILNIVPIAGEFAPAALQPLFALVPPFWPVRLFWALQAGDPYAGLLFAGGLIYQVALIALLARRLEKLRSYMSSEF